MRLKRAEYHLFKRLEQLPEQERRLCMDELEEYVQARIEKNDEIISKEVSLLGELTGFLVVEEDK